jgi:predicted metalloprotease with PDZ domain
MKGSLIWLEADVLIRQRSGSKLSLDDFLPAFPWRRRYASHIKPYTFDDVVNTLNDVTPYDWRTF